MSVCRYTPLLFSEKQKQCGHGLSVGRQLQCVIIIFFFSVKKKTKTKNNVVMACPLGDGHLDLHGTDLQLCHENEHINCYTKGKRKQQIAKAPWQPN